MLRRTRANPWGDEQFYFHTPSIRGFVDEIFEPWVISPLSPTLPNTTAPSFELDVHQSDGKYTVTADLPGMAKNNITVTVENGILNVTARREDNREETKDGRYTVTERRYGQFSRSVHLEGASERDVKAQYADGVLTIEVPRNDGRETRRIIEIQ